MTFQFDTSGSVTILPHQSASGTASARYWRWPDLSPFRQGYVEALFAEFAATLHGLGDVLPNLNGIGSSIGLAFSDLAPETLAAILVDTGEMRARSFSDEPQAARHNGRLTWQSRQAGKLHQFPPVTVILGDDGKVRFQ